MLCENCKKNNATTHLKTVINGKVYEQHLCSQCAKEKGVVKDFGLDNPLLSIMNSVFGGTMLNSGENVKRCKGCNSSFEDIINHGKLGCSDCYDTFYDELLPYFKRIHGDTKHIGKIAYTVNEEKTNEEAKTSDRVENDKDTIHSLKEELKKLINEENFEKAAVVRDKIKALEESEK